MGKLGWLAVIIVLARVAEAQQAPPPAPASAPAAPVDPAQPYGPPGQPPPAGYYAQPPPPAQPITISAEDQQLLNEGEMPLVQHAGGGALAFFLGFGTGHMLQGRWGEIGWVFTLGDAASYAAVIYGMTQICIDCTNNAGPGTLILVGVLGIVGFHVWETLDAFIVPANRNRRVRELRMRLGMPPQPQPMGLYLSPVHGGNGMVGGLTLRF